MRALFVDSRRKTRELFVPCLANQDPGHLVFPRADGQGLIDCLACVNRGYFGVAIINNNIGHPSGVELLNLIRRNDEFGSLPVIICGDDCVREVVQMLGADFVSTRHRATVLDRLLVAFDRLQEGCV